jgi:hypothetical protein
MFFAPNRICFFGGGKYREKRKSEGSITPWELDSNHHCHPLQPKTPYNKPTTRSDRIPITSSGLDLFPAPALHVVINSNNEGTCDVQSLDELQEQYFCPLKSTPLRSIQNAVIIFKCLFSSKPEDFERGADSPSSLAENSPRNQKGSLSPSFGT